MKKPRHRLDMTGPYEVLARLPNTTVDLVARTRDPVTTDRGMQIVPTVTNADCPPLDVVMVPGGPGQQDLMGGVGALRDIRVHRLAGARRGRPAQGPARHLSLGGDRSPDAARRHSGARTRGGGRQYRDRRRCRIGHRFRVGACRHPRRRAGRPRNPAADRIRSGAAVQFRLTADGIA